MSAAFTLDDCDTHTQQHRARDVVATDGINIRHASENDIKAVLGLLQDLCIVSQYNIPIYTGTMNRLLWPRHTYTIMISSSVTVILVYLTTNSAVRQPALTSDTVSLWPGQSETDNKSCAMALGQAYTWQLFSFNSFTTRT